MKHFLSRIFLFFLLVGLVAACQEERITPYDPRPQAEADDALIKEFIAKDTTIKNPVRTASGLYYVKRSGGNGKQIKAGDVVKTHYIGKFINGSTFESSYAANNPITFIVGEGKVIKGWDEGFQLMEEGETARLYIPSGLAYGPRSNGSIPPDSPLIFDVTILKVN